MAELHQYEDMAAQYVFGGLTAAERRNFEAEMASSTELRSLVRELEEGAVLLANSAPRKRPPAKVWQAIEKEIGVNSNAKKIIPAFWTTWWKYGWAAAAACVVGWLIYAVHSGRL